jgi:hypothetical protein
VSHPQLDVRYLDTVPHYDKLRSIFTNYDEEIFDRDYQQLELLISKFGKLSFGMLVLDKLIGNGDSDNPLKVPITYHAEKDEVLQMVINHGELDEAKKLNGIGMRIIFDQDKGAQLWQGQFKNNVLHGFGRKLWQQKDV